MDKQLAKQIFTRQIVEVDGAALAQGVPVGSIILQYNEWRIGDTQASLIQKEKQVKYGKKEVYYLDMNGNFGRIYVKGGLMGISSYDFMVEKSMALEWLKQLEEWKINNPA